MIYLSLEQKFQIWIVKTSRKILLNTMDQLMMKESPNDVLIRRSSFFSDLMEKGYEVRKITEYHYRVNGFLDIYPKNARWHDIRNNTRGGFEGVNLCSFVVSYIKNNS